MTRAFTKLDTVFQPECGCSVGQCNHGAGSAGNGESGIAAIRGQLEQNAQDQENGIPHCGLFIEWYERVEQDLERLMGDTHLPDLDEVRQTIHSQVEKVKQIESILPQSVQETRDLAARL